MKLFGARIKEGNKVKHILTEQIVKNEIKFNMRNIENGDGLDYADYYLTILNSLDSINESMEDYNNGKKTKGSLNSATICFDKNGDGWARKGEFGQGSKIAIRFTVKNATDFVYSTFDGNDQAVKYLKELVGYDSDDMIAVDEVVEVIDYSEKCYKINEQFVAKSQTKKVDGKLFLKKWLYGKVFN